MVRTYPDSNVHVAHMGPTWVLSAPGGPHVGPMSLPIRVDTKGNMGPYISLNRRQAIVTFDVGLVYWSIYAAPGLDYAQISYKMW